MNRLKLPLYGKMLAWFALNLVVLGLLLFIFLKAQFRLGLDWMLAGAPGDRIAAIGDQVAYELSRLPEHAWNQRLTEWSQPQGVVYALVDGNGVQWFGRELTLPQEVQSRLLDRRAPRSRPPRPTQQRPANAPPKPRFMLRAGAPPVYWAGIHLDLTHGRNGRPLSLVMVSDSILGGGLFMDLWPWLGLMAAALLLSALIWLPFVRGINGFITSLNQAAANIAQGRFNERVQSARNDELGQLAVSVNAMASQLGKYVAQQRRITADVAHELCSPIARMQMALGVAGQRSSPGQAIYLEKLDRELQHMARLVEEVLAFSKAETLPEREAPETFLLQQLVAQVVAREASETPVHDDVPDVEMHTLRSALDRALGNILRNAVRYAKEIEIIGEATGNTIVLEVRDRGPGVSEDTLHRLFEPFFRPEAARSRHTGGSGLGLAIAKRCIEACQGSITAKIREGGGLVFECRLPHDRMSKAKISHLPLITTKGK
jgi:two-component system sensor histidine kinase CpxA